MGTLWIKSCYTVRVSELVWKRRWKKKSPPLCSEYERRHTVSRQSCYGLISLIMEVLQGSDHVGRKSCYVPLLLERWLHVSANSVDKNIPRLRECRGREGQNVAVRQVLLSEAIGMLGGSDGSLDQYMEGGGDPLATGLTRVWPQRALVYCCAMR